MIGKNYFEPIDEGEDYFYTIDSDQNVKYETLESIYNQFFTKESTQEAKDISLYIRNKNKYIDKSLTYGEVTFRSMAYIFEFCKSRFDIDKDGYFYDLGSGIGCGVISALLCFTFKRYIGIEFINALNNKANINKKIFLEKFADIHKKYDKFLPEYIFDDEVKNEIFIEIKKEKKKKIEKKEEEIDEEEAIRLQEEKLKQYMIESHNPHDHLNVLDIIYGKDEGENGQGYMSYAKKCKIRNELFFLEYERKLKLQQKQEENERELERKKMSQSPGYVRRGTVHFLLHGPGSVLNKLETKPEEKKKDEEKSSDKRESFLVLHEMEKESDKKKKKKEKKVEDKKSEDSESIQKERIVIPYIEFICENFMNTDLTKASFIFCNSTCFSSELLLSIARKVNKEVPNGCIVITFTKKLPFLNKEDWDIKKGFKRLMSWGLATVFVHRKIKVSKASGKSSTSKSGSKSGSNSYSSSQSESSSSH